MNQILTGINDFMYTYILLILLVGKVENVIYDYADTGYAVFYVYA